MTTTHRLRTFLMLGCSAVAAAMSSHALAQDFSVPAGDLKHALDVYRAQTGIPLVVSSEAIKGVQSRGAKGELSADGALSRILSGTGFTAHRDPSGMIAVVHEASSELEIQPLQLAQAGPAPRASVETVTVTSSKLGGADVQSIPIAITALSQEELTSRQVAGGPDLIKEVPNLTFTKTNFTGYSIQIRGIGTQAISVTTDPAVAVAFNDTPFIRNHFFEQEFYDVSQVEVLRGPQGTLYGRNATAGVVNVTSAKPTDQFEAMASADIGNYKNRRFEAMLNLPIQGDKVDLRLAGEWTKRDGYSFNTLTNSPIDGRDLWSSRLSLRWKPIENLTADFVWEHFSEDDDRLRSSKQLCKRDPAPSEVLGQSTAVGASGQNGVAFLGQGCLPTSMYSPDAFGVPNALSLPYYGGIQGAGFGLSFAPLGGFIGPLRDPYASVSQSTNLRDIQSTLNPRYTAKNDTLELNAEWRATPTLTVNSATGFNRDFLWSTEDYNRFNTEPGIFSTVDIGGSPRTDNMVTPDGNYACYDGYLSIGQGCIAAGHGNIPNSAPSDGTPTGIFCDPQLGCSNRLVGEDLSDEHAWQFSQELRVGSNFSGPFNFSAGGNYLHYETEENYYVFFNTLTMFAAHDGFYGRQQPWMPFADTNEQCVPFGHEYQSPFVATGVEDCPGYIDPHSLTQLDNQGHNYFLSQNPYNLNSYAFFGEAYYNVTKDLKLTGGLRWTDDQKHFVEIPSELLTRGYGYPITGVLDQEWKEWTGRFVANWSPQIPFTDQSMFYASYSHGYKAGGANPPGAVLLDYSTQLGDITNPTHPKSFNPEFNDAFELGTKNTALDGGLTFNANVFYYNYKGYQISYIVDRSAVNLNFDATVKGAELQASWEPIPGLKFGLSGGYEKTRLADGSKAIDLADRTAGNPNWLLVKPFPSQASNCVLPTYVVAALINPAITDNQLQLPVACGETYNLHNDPVTWANYTASPPTNASGNAITGYPGFDPLAGTPGDPYTGQNTYNGIDYGPAPNNGQGFYKDLSGKELPNAPHYTVSLTADWTVPLSPDWAATVHSDYYWQSHSWARVFNAINDKINGYSTINMALILTDTSGWQVMGYVKNVLDVTAITGTFLNSDDTGLTTNIFLTDPRLFGVRVTKHFDGGDSGSDIFGSIAGKHPTAWITLGGSFAQLQDDWQKFDPAFASTMPAGLPNPTITEKAPGASFDWEGNIQFRPEDSDWVLKAGVRYGRSSRRGFVHKSLPLKTANEVAIPPSIASIFGLPTMVSCTWDAQHFNPGQECPFMAKDHEFVDSQSSQSETHAMIDFTLGKDVGIGLFGKDGTIGAGVRMAQFTSHAQADLNSDPHYNFPSPLPLAFYNSPKYGEVFDGTTDEQRSFHGAGPEVTWDESVPVLGNEDDGAVSIDWGVNAAALFGKQRVKIQRAVSQKNCQGFNGFNPAYCVAVYSTPTDIERSRTVTVPNFGGYLGASAQYRNAKINFGYRADFFFNALDGGQDTAKSYGRGFYGPYLNVSIGLGG